MTSPGQPAGGGRRLLLPAGVVLAVVVVANAAFVRFAASERTLYTADHVAYFAMSASVAEALARAPLPALAGVVRSIDERELNLLPATPIALVMTVFGRSRLVYLLAILNLYAIPTLLAVAALVARLARGAARPSVVVWSTAVAVLLLPAFWWPICLGYLDVGGLLLCLVAVIVYFSPPGRSPATLQLAVVGATLALVFLFRRWYAFWSVAFGVLVVVDSLAMLWGNRRDRAALAAALRPPLVIGAAAVVAAAVMAPHLLLQVVTTDYADRFAAYKVHASLAAELAAWRDHFGAVAVAAFVVAIAVVAAAPARRRVAALLTLHLVVTFTLMRRVQDPSPQHWYLYLAVILVIVAWALTAALAALRSPGRRLALVVASSAVAVVSTGWAVAAPAGALAGWLPGPRLVPQVRHDLSEVERLLAYLDRLVVADPGYVYILGSTPTLSDTTLGFANLSLGTHFVAPGLIAQSAHMDLRDGFPANLLAARYVVVSDPVQCRQPPTDQQVVAVPAAHLLAGRGVGAAFSRLPGHFLLDGPTTAFVYRRERPFTADEVATLVDELRAAWPDRPFVYSPPPPAPSGVE